MYAIIINNTKKKKNKNKDLVNKYFGSYFSTIKRTYFTP